MPTKIEEKGSYTVVPVVFDSFLLVLFDLADHAPLVFYITSSGVAYNHAWSLAGAVDCRGSA